MKLAIIAAAALGVAATAASAHDHKGGAKGCPAATPAAVEGLFKQFNDAWATKNPDTVTALFTKEPVLLATVSNKPRTTPAEVRDYFVGFLKNSPVGTINTSTVEIDCKTASRLGT